MNWYQYGEKVVMVVHAHNGIHVLVDDAGKIVKLGDEKWKFSKEEIDALNLTPVKEAPVKKVAKKK